MRNLPHILNLRTYMPLYHCAISALEQQQDVQLCLISSSTKPRSGVRTLSVQVLRCAFDNFLTSSGALNRVQTTATSQKVVKGATDEERLRGSQTERAGTGKARKRSRSPSCSRATPVRRQGGCHRSHQ